MTDLIDLQNCHVTQVHTDGSLKTQWIVRKNITSEDLYELPAHFDEADVFAVLDFARKFELIAFNAGINMQKNNGNPLLLQQISALENNLNMARIENERLADKLEKIINKE